MTDIPTSPIDDLADIRHLESLVLSDADSERVLVRQRGRPLEDLRTRSYGRVEIRDADTDEIILEAHNDVHPENLSEALALTLSHRGRGNIHQMVFGNGASLVTGTGAVSYYPPNVIGQSSSLYNETYAKIIDDQSVLNLDPANNRLEVIHVAGNTYTDIRATCLLDYSEPAGQRAFDDMVDIKNPYVFDEIGLRSYDITGLPRLLTHCMFHPTPKALNRRLKVQYTLRIMMG